MMPRRILTPMPTILRTSSPESCGINGALNISAAASGAWSVANTALLVPFRVLSSYLPSWLWWINGATASGNADMGIYTADGTKIWANGSVAQGSINTLQKVTYAGSRLAPGKYYWALVFDNTTATVFRWSTAAINAPARCGIYVATSAFALPSTVTLLDLSAGQTGSLIPEIGMGNGTVL